MLVLQALIVSLTCMGLGQAGFSERAMYSLNNYAEGKQESHLPYMYIYILFSLLGTSGRCVIDLGENVYYLRFGDSIIIPKLPCTSVLCMGDGWGALLT